MNHTQDISKIRDLIEKANDILIVSHERPNADAIGSALSLYLGLTSLSKKVTIACPDPMTVEFSSYVGVNKILTQIAKKNFVISLDYVEGSIEKVSYNIEGNTFNLVVEPRPGFEGFNEEKVHFAHAGNSADLIIAIDTIHLGGLKKLYEGDKDLFATKPIVNIDRHPNNVQYGTINYIEASASSTAELVWKLLEGLSVAITEDIGSNLLNAVYAATNNFSNFNVTADAFALTAECMKNGGKRFRKSTQEPVKTEPVTKPVEEPVVETPVLEPIPMTVPAQPILDTPVAETPTAASQSLPKPQEAPADWLKPKIFKSSRTE
jgi:nanoRNase/pAp phosphatase (c-di-AMP/oligoRNAs hydrolase)